MSEPVTELLHKIRAKEPGALDALVLVVYDELKRMSGRMRYGQPRDATLDTTALVHETYLKLVGSSQVEINDRRHFFALAGRVMRQVLTDHARRKLADKRGAMPQQVSLSSQELAVLSEAEQLVELDQALTRLAANDLRQAQVVECRFFAGLSEEQTAEALGVSLRTVQGDWAKARAFLLGNAGDEAR